MVPYKPKTTEIHKYKNRLIQAKHYGIKTTVLTIMKNISGPGLLHFHLVVVHRMHDVVAGSRSPKLTLSFTRPFGQVKDWLSSCDGGDSLMLLWPRELVVSTV